MDATSTLKAIETQYKGYRFRSRLDARWAVFFDLIGVQWEYEPEGFDLGPVGYYLPDFRLRDKKGHPVYVEVKPTVAIDDRTIRTVIALAKGVQKTEKCGAVTLVQGDPLFMKGYLLMLMQPICLQGPFTKTLFPNFFSMLANSDEKKILDAAQAARAARFEHGEKGARA